MQCCNSSHATHNRSAAETGPLERVRRALHRGKYVVEQRQGVASARAGDTVCCSSYFGIRLRSEALSRGTLLVIQTSASHVWEVAA